MSLNDELTQITAVAIECEKEIQNGTLDANAIVSKIRSVAGTEAQIAKTGEMIALLTGTLNQLQLIRLKELKNQYPHDSHINELGRRVVKCSMALYSIMSSVSEMLVTPDVRPTMHAQNQKQMAEFERIFSSFFQ